MKIKQEYREYYDANAFGIDWESGVEKEVYVVYNNKDEELAVCDSEEAAWEEIEFIEETTK